MKKQYIIYILLALLFGSCTKVVLKIDEVPPNTPPGADIYVAGNFNYWDPGDQKYIMKFQPDSSYILELPNVLGNINYKFTRGDWSTVEENRCGNEIGDREILDKTDTVYNVIESWADLDPVNCDSITIVIENIPESTPESKDLRIAGSFNAWNPGNDPNYKIKTDTLTKKMTVTIPRQAIEGHTSPELQYKFVRDSVSIPEVDKYGREIDARTLNFEKGDTVKVNIDNWADKVTLEDNLITIVLSQIPKNTPQKDKIFLTGNFNNWNPSDYKYMFKETKNNKLAISLPREKYGLSFKITRGSWDTEFSTKCGKNLNDQNYNYDEIDTIFFTVEGWIDFKPQISKFVTFIIDSLPENTPIEDDLFLRIFTYDLHYEVPKYKFDRDKHDQYVLSIPRNKVDNYKRFVLMRNDFISQQVDEHGRYIKEQSMKDICADTVLLIIDDWNDLTELNNKTTTITITKLPKHTPKNPDLYLVGLFNAWNPGDKQFQLTKNSFGDFTITVPQRYLRDGFKFTRGSWETVEGSKFSMHIMNRYCDKNVEQLNIEIKGWE